MKTSTDICPPERRQAVLTERRRLKMAVPAHSYVRGSTLKFYEWLGVGKKKKNSEGFCLVDIKEAVPAEAPHSAKVPMPRDHAERVVEGARKLSPFLGQRMLAGHFSGTPAVLRELLPQDLKLEMDQLTREEAIGASRFSHTSWARLTRNKWTAKPEKMGTNPEIKSPQKARRALMALDQHC